MFVFVKVNAREGSNFVPRARRFWPAGQTIKVELRDEEPEDVIARTPEGVTFSAPPLDVLGPQSYEAIKNDSQNRFTIMSDLESQASISQDSVNVARQEAQKLSGELVDLKAENAGLKTQLDAADVEIEDLENQVAAAKAENDALRARIAELEAASSKPKGK